MTEPAATDRGTISGPVGPRARVPRVRPLTRPLAWPAAFPGCTG